MDEMKPAADHPICSERPYRFSTRDLAWAFMDACDELAGWLAGYPMPEPGMNPSAAAPCTYAVRVYRSKAG